MEPLLLLNDGSAAAHGTGPFTTDTVTPPDGDSLLVLVVAYETENTGTVPDIDVVDTEAHTWTQEGIALGTVGITNYGQSVAIFTAENTDDTPFTIDVEADTSTDMIVEVQCWSVQHSAGIPVPGQFKGVAGTNTGTPSVTFDSTPRSTSRIFAAVVADEDGSPGSVTEDDVARRVGRRDPGPEHPNVRPAAVHLRVGDGHLPQRVGCHRDLGRGSSPFRCHSRRMTCLHVVGLPHTNLTDRFSWCAYTGKVRRFPKMMEPHGYMTVVYHAGLGEDNDDWKVGHYQQVLTETRTRSPVRRHDPRVRRRPVLHVQQAGHRRNRQDHRAPRHHLPVGGRASATRDRRLVPEQHHVRVRRRLRGRVRELHLFRVVRVDAHRLRLVEGREHDGRPLLRRRHPELLRRLPVPAGARLRRPRRLPPVPGPARRPQRHPRRVRGREARGDAARYRRLGHTTRRGRPSRDRAARERAELLAGAWALIQPTMFLEPFGGSVVEAMLSGLPVVTSDWGAFPENVRDGIDGYRCRTLKEFVDAAHTIHELPITEEARQADARERWSMEAVGPQYDRWFKRLDTLHEAGWYSV